MEKWNSGGFPPALLPKLAKFHQMFFFEAGEHHEPKLKSGHPHTVSFPALLPSTFTFRHAKKAKKPSPTQPKNPCPLKQSKQFGARCRRMKKGQQGKKKKNHIN